MVYFNRLSCVIESVEAPYTTRPKMPQRFTYRLHRKTRNKLILFSSFPYLSMFKKIKKGGSAEPQRFQ